MDPRDKRDDDNLGLVSILAAIVPRLTRHPPEAGRRRCQPAIHSGRNKL
jgi:hypothetical protein